jgi:Na+-driven multidrug efflux pump
VLVAYVLRADLAWVWASIVSNWALRVPLAVLVAYVLRADLAWVWAVILFDHVARSAWLAVSFRRGRWRGPT